MKSHDREIIDAHMRNAHCARVYTGEWNPLEWYRISIHINAPSHMLEPIHKHALLAQMTLFRAVRLLFIRILNNHTIAASKNKTSMWIKGEKSWGLSVKWSFVVLIVFLCCMHPSSAGHVVLAQCTTIQRSIIWPMVQKQKSIICLAAFGRSAVGSPVSLLRFTQIEC